MKKCITLLLAICLLFSAAACAAQREKDPPHGADGRASDVSLPASEDSSETAPTGFGDLSIESGGEPSDATSSRDETPSGEASSRETPSGETPDSPDTSGSQPTVPTDPTGPTDAPSYLPITFSLQNDNSAAHEQTVRCGNIAELKELYELAAAIGNKYGLYINIADNVPQEILFSGAEPLTDPALIRRALERSDAIFSLYPSGFFDQLVYGPYVRLEYNILGFVSIGTGYVSRRQAEKGLVQFVCMDAESDDLIDAFNYTLPHEITHLCDYRLIYVSAHSEGRLFSEETWAAYNPAGFTYSDGDNDLENRMYEQYFEYFDFSYGCMNALEDRATLFGRLMERGISGYTDRYFTEPCQRKLAYYISCLRDGFDSSGWGEQTVWESYFSVYE